MIDRQTLDDLATSLDPALLMEDLGFIPDDWQRSFLRCDARRTLLLCGRQMGKSTSAACLGLHSILYNPGSLVVCISPTQRQSGELFNDKSIHFYNRLGRPVPSVTHSATSLVLANGSRVVSLPGNADTVRSFSAVSVLIVDEVSRVDDELLGAVTPMLATSNGRLVLCSTPCGARGLFYEYWSSGDPMWQRFRVTADDCPRITKEFLDAELKTLGPRMFRQEYQTEFLVATDQYFSTDYINKAFVYDLEPMFPDIL
jgi:hypothetical protein